LLKVALNTINQIKSNLQIMARTSWVSMRWHLLCIRPTCLVGLLQC
jgi:hypothetical protein